MTKLRPTFIISSMDNIKYQNIFFTYYHMSVLLIERGHSRRKRHIGVSIYIISIVQDNGTNGGTKGSKDVAFIRWVKFCLVRTMVNQYD